MERDNDTGVGEVLQVQLLLTADRHKGKKKKKIQTDKDEKIRVTL